jgi:PhnB protein
MRKFIPMPKGEHTVTPYLAIKGAKAAIQFYSQVFGANEVGRLLGPDGAIAHCELQLGDSIIMLAEENIEWGNKSPSTLGDSPVTIALYVDDVDVTFQRALDAGAKQVMPIKDEF